MAEPKGNATLKAIAEEAGVTITTVSCILNNKGGKYAAKTKAKVQAIADRPQVPAQCLGHERPAPARPAPLGS